MKRFIILFLITLSYTYPQTIHSIPVPGSLGASLTQASSEFNYIRTNMSYLTWTAQNLTSTFHYESLPLPPTAWPLSMLVVNNSRRPNGTAEEVRAYAIAFRFETNSTLKTIYETRAKQGAEFLLWLMTAAGNDGGIPDLIDDYTIDVSIKGPHHTAAAGCAFYECYLSFGDAKYRTALENTANWEISHSCYPFTYYFPPSRSGEGTKKYYGRVNHQARALENLSNAYKITGNQLYLNRAIQIAEELIAWQDQNQVGNCWPSGSIPDGSWWWENRDPNPIPSGVDSSPNPGATLAAERKIDYHCLTLDGLVALLESTQQQVLPGTTTIRNNVSFASFKSNLISSIKKAINYIIDNQEITNNSSLNQYRGLIQSYKLHSHAVWNTLYSGYNNSAPHGLFSIINSYLSLLKTNTLSTDDRNRLESLINSVSETLIGKYSFNWGWEETTPILLLDWAKMMNYRSLSSISPTLTLNNPSFEERNTIWELWSWNGGGVTISNSYARTGSNSVRLLDNDPHAGMWAEQMTTATAGTTYKAEAYARIINSRQSLYLLFYDQNFNLLDFNYSHAYANSAWEKITVQMTAPTNTTYAVVKAHADWYWTSDGYWDDFSLTTVLQKQSSEIQIPISFSLQNYPNPFNPTTKIGFSLPQKDHVQLKVFDSIGREVASLANGIFEPGKHEIEFNAVNLPSGVYFYNIITSHNLATKKMLLIK
ncbi:MAG: T9SS type A sorting domain-containing protein [Bacteroidota bacterium]